MPLNFFLYVWFGEDVRPFFVILEIKINTWPPQECALVDWSNPLTLQENNSQNFLFFFLSFHCSRLSPSGWQQVYTWAGYVSSNLVLKNPKVLGKEAENFCFYSSKSPKYDITKNNWQYHHIIYNNRYSLKHCKISEYQRHIKHVLKCLFS